MWDLSRIYKDHSNFIQGLSSMEGLALCHFIQSFSSFLFRAKLFLRHHLLLNGKSESGGTYAASYTWCKYQYDLRVSLKLHSLLQPRQLYSFTIPDMNFGEQFRIGVRTINDKNNLESLIEWLVLRAPNCLDVLGFNYTLCGGLWCVKYP